MRTIITIQHTQSVHHTNGMIGSLTDWELSEKGKQQAQLLGKNLSQELAGAPFTVYCSDLQRAVQTAEPLCRYLKTSPIPCKALRERDLGSAVGKSVAWLHEQQREHPEWLERTVDDRCLPDAASRRECYEILHAFYRETVQKTDGNLILISHGDALSLFHAIWLGLSPESLNHCGLNGLPGGVSWLLEDDEGRHIIRRLSDLSYLIQREGRVRETGF